MQKRALRTGIDVAPMSVTKSYDLSNEAAMAETIDSEPF